MVCVVISVPGLANVCVALVGFTSVGLAVVVLATLAITAVLKVPTMRVGFFSNGCAATATATGGGAAGGLGTVGWDLAALATIAVATPGLELERSFVGG